MVAAHFAEHLALKVRATAAPVFIATGSSADQARLHMLPGNQKESKGSVSIEHIENQLILTLLIPADPIDPCLTTPRST